VFAVARRFGEWRRKRWELVRNNFLAVARKFSRPWLGISPCSARYACAFLVPHASKAVCSLSSSAHFVRCGRGGTRTLHVQYPNCQHYLLIISCNSRTNERITYSHGYI